MTLLIKKKPQTKQNCDNIKTYKACHFSNKKDFDYLYAKASPCTLAEYRTGLLVFCLEKQQASWTISKIKHLGTHKIACKAEKSQLLLQPDIRISLEMQ